VQLTEIAYRGRRHCSCSRISDGSGILTLRFFYFSSSQQANLARGTRVRCFGEVRRGPLGLEMVHPEYRRLFAQHAPLEETLTPIYPSTEGVPQGRLRALIGEALREAIPVRDWIARPSCPRPWGCPPDSPRCSRRSATCTRHRARRSSPSSPPGAIPRSAVSPSKNCSPIT
jgi:RecG-like helicase